MEKEVSNCMECPLANRDYDLCMHPDRKGRVETEDKKIPSDCPLLKEPITISIKK